MNDQASRNVRMAERIGATAVHYPFSFVIAGDSGAWPDPTADAIFAQLLRQTADLRPARLLRQSRRLCRARHPRTPSALPRARGTVVHPERLSGR
jgi:hypothetical protein